MPSFLQSKLASVSANQRGGSYWGAGIMGVFSALIIGPCVTAPLAGALLYISQTGNALLGGAALFSLGLGMGLPLLAAGTFAGRLMPKAGAWMEAVKAFFGLGLLAVAIGLLGRILPPAVTLSLGAMLATLPVFLLLRKRRWRLASVTSAAYGGLLWLGVSGHFGQAIPTMVCTAVAACEQSRAQTLFFNKISSVEDLKAQLELTKKLNKPVMLDFYADWCTACVEMKYSTFTDPSIHQVLADTVLLQADVTQQTDELKALLKQFNLIGPPAILFFNTAQIALPQARIIGFVDTEQFLAKLPKAFSPKS